MPSRSPEEGYIQEGQETGCEPREPEKEGGGTAEAMSGKKRMAKTGTKKAIAPKAAALMEKKA